MDKDEEKQKKKFREFAIMYEVETEDLDEYTVKFATPEIRDWVGKYLRHINN